MSNKRHIVSTCNSRTVERGYTRRKTNKRSLEVKKMVTNSREVQSKLMKGLLDLIILQFLKGEPMHGYQIITKIRRSFGVYFGPSTIYPLLAQLEKKKYVKSEWNMDSERPRKVYKLTNEGQGLLNFTEDSLNFICMKIGTPGVGKESLAQETTPPATIRPLMRRTEGPRALI